MTDDKARQGIVRDAGGLLVKTTYAPDFLETLDAVGVNAREWRLLARGTGTQRSRRSKWVRQFVRKVQRVHTGSGMWRGGRYVRRGEGCNRGKI